MVSTKVRVLVMRPGQAAEELWINPEHEVLRNIVGGEIEMKNPLDDGTVVICRKDADGVPNRILRNARGQEAARFCGTLIISGVFLKAGELDSLTDREVQQAKRRLEPYRRRSG